MKVDTKKSRPAFFTVNMSMVEREKLQKAWKRDSVAENRSQYVKAAINAYAGEEIFS